MKERKHCHCPPPVSLKSGVRLASIPVIDVYFPSCVTDSVSLPSPPPVSIPPIPRSHSTPAKSLHAVLPSQYKSSPFPSTLHYELTSGNTPPQVTLEVAFVYLKEAQVACGSTAITSSALGGRGDSRAVLISLSREDQVCNNNVTSHFTYAWSIHCRM